MMLAAATTTTSVPPSTSSSALAPLRRLSARWWRVANECTLLSSMPLLRATSAALSALSSSSSSSSLSSSSSSSLSSSLSSSSSSSSSSLSSLSSSSPSDASLDGALSWLHFLRWRARDYAYRSEQPRLQRRGLVIVGGGPAGVATAARFLRYRERRWLHDVDVCIVDSAAHHHDKSQWPLAATGNTAPSRSVRAMASVVPAGADWLRDEVVRVLPEQSALETAGGVRIEYQALVLAAGMRADVDGIAGLRDALDTDAAHSGVVCADSYEQVVRARAAIDAAPAAGNVVFTLPVGAVGGDAHTLNHVWLTRTRLLAPARRVAAAVCRAVGASERARALECAEHRLVATTPHRCIVPSARFDAMLTRMADEHGVDVRRCAELVGIDARRRIAHFRRTDAPPSYVHGDERSSFSLPYSLLFVATPQRAPAFIARSGLGDRGGFVAVNRGLVHRRFANIFAVGDCVGDANAAADEYSAPRSVPPLSLQPRARDADWTPPADSDGVALAARACATGAPEGKNIEALAAQVPVVVHNVCATLSAQPAAARYDGFSAYVVHSSPWRAVLGLVSINDVTFGRGVEYYADSLHHNVLVDVDAARAPLAHGIAVRLLHAPLYSLLLRGRWAGPDAFWDKYEYTKMDSPHTRFWRQT